MASRNKKSKRSRYLTEDIGERLKALRLERGLTLTRLAGDRTRVVIVLDKREPGKLPAHLHIGSCKVLTSDIKAGLNDVVRGRSVTTLDLPTWTEIRHARISVHVHVPSFVVIACGEVPR